MRAPCYHSLRIAFSYVGLRTTTATSDLRSGTPPRRHLRDSSSSRTQDPTGWSWSWRGRGVVAVEGFRSSGHLSLLLYVGRRTRLQFFVRFSKESAKTKADRVGDVTEFTFPAVPRRATTCASLGVVTLVYGRHGCSRPEVYKLAKNFRV